MSDSTPPAERVWGVSRSTIAPGEEMVWIRREGQPNEVWSKRDFQMAWRTGGLAGVDFQASFPCTAQDELKAACRAALAAMLQPSGSTSETTE